MSYVKIHMKHAFQTEFGRAQTCALTSEKPVDKWDVLNQLTKAATHFELSHRTLTVLKALLTFLPGRDLTPGPKAIVFPANATLSDRLHGMPESTLRRHLAKLVQSGIVSRHDSPNRKRYARKIGANVEVAYGFDLSPLATHSDVINNAAQDAEIKAQEIAVERDRLLALRLKLIEDENDHTALLQRVHSILRRKPDLDLLRDTIQAVTAQINPTQIVSRPTDKLSASDSQNERHIQDSVDKDLDSEGTDAKQSAQPSASTKLSEKGQGVTLSQVLDVCQEFKNFYPEKVRDWNALINIGDRTAPMLGIDYPVMAQAKKAMGLECAAIAIMCILERFKQIKSPGAYLRRLTQMAEQGQFSIVPMLNALKQRNSSIVS